MRKHELQDTRLAGCVGAHHAGRPARMCRIAFAEFANRFRLVFSRIKDDNTAYLATERLRKEASDSKLVVPSEAARARGSPATSEMLEVDAWTRDALQRVGLALFRGGFGVNAPAVFSRIDLDGDGLLSFIEFEGALRELKMTFTPEEVKRLVTVIDTNHSGSVNYVEFVQAFKIADLTGGSHLGGLTTAPAGAAGASGGSAGAAAAPSSARRSSRDAGASGASGELSAHTNRSWQRGVIEQIVSTLYEYRVELAAAFRMFDLDGNGVISAEEFRQGLQALTGLAGSPITDMQADEMLRALDRDNDGTINYEEVGWVACARCLDARRAHGGASFLCSLLARSSSWTPSPVANHWSPTLTLRHTTCNPRAACCVRARPPMR